MTADREKLARHLRLCKCGSFPAYPIVPFRSNDRAVVGRLAPVDRWLLAGAAERSSAEIHDRLAYWGLREFIARHQVLADGMDEVAVLNVARDQLLGDDPMSRKAAEALAETAQGVRKKAAQLQKAEAAEAAEAERTKERNRRGTLRPAYSAERYYCPEVGMKSGAMPGSYVPIGTHTGQVLNALSRHDGLWSLLAAVLVKLVRVHLGVPPWSTWNVRKGKLKTMIHEHIEVAMRSYLGQVAMRVDAAGGMRDLLQPRVAAGLLGGLDSLQSIRGMSLPACFDLSRATDERLVIDGACELLSDSNIWVMVVADLAHDMASALSDPLRSWCFTPDERNDQVWEDLHGYLHDRLKPAGRESLKDELAGESPTSSESPTEPEVADYPFAMQHYLPRMYRMRDFCKWMHAGGKRGVDKAAANWANDLGSLGQEACQAATRPGEDRPGFPASPAVCASGPTQT